MHEGIVAHFADVKTTPVDRESIESFESEGQFIGVLVDLLTEAGSYLICASSIYPSGHEGWTRNEAVIGGSLVRLYKLVDAILDQTVKHRRETSFILSRLHFETAINAMYLMAFPKEEAFDNFVRYSLQHEIELKNRIAKNIESRGGVLAIEERMLKSIENAFRAAEVDTKEMPERRLRDWAGNNLFQRAEALNLSEAYLGVFKNASIMVHGNWGDLYQHHLERKGDRFFAKHDFSFPRPQYLEVNALFSVWTAAAFIDFLGLFQERKALQSIFEDFERRIRALSELHEEFIQQQ